MEDPYELSLPEGWTAAADEQRVAYTSADGAERVTLRESVLGLALYWFVELETRRDGAGAWVERPLDVGDPFTDWEDAAERTDRLIRNLDRGYCEYAPEA
ncbi:MAG: hypothetical protein ABEJ04_01590 [Halobacteriaceae archaeon]